MVEIGVFIVGFFLGGMSGIFVTAMAASASMSDRRTRETTDKGETDNDS